MCVTESEADARTRVSLGGEWEHIRIAMKATIDVSKAMVFKTV